MVRIAIRSTWLVEMLMMVSGHYDDLVSEYASKNLMKEVDGRCHCQESKT